MNIVETTYRATPEQAYILLHSNYHSFPCERLTSSLPSDLHPNLFERAWEMTIARYPALRTWFEWKGLRDPVQHVVPPSFDCMIDRVSADDEFETTHDASWRLRCDPSLPALMHLSLGKEEGNEWRFAWTSHDLILDSRARRIVMESVASIYESLLNNLSVDLSESTLFEDYVKALPRGDGSEAAYWRKKGDVLTRPCKLALPRTSRAIPDDDRWGSLAVRISREGERQLLSFANRIGICPEVVVECAWAILLSKYSGQREVTFGSMQSQRIDLSGSDGMVGPIASTVPRHLNLDSRRAVVEVLNELSLQVIESARFANWRSAIQGRLAAHQETPFETVVRLRESSATVQTLSGNSLWSGQRHRAFTGSAMTLTGSVSSDAPDVQLEIEYDNARWEGIFLADMGKHLASVLETFGYVERIADFSLNCGKMKQELILVGRSSGIASRNSDCVCDLFERQVRRVPSNIAVVHEGRRISYKELNEKADWLALQLRNIGVVPEEIVGVYLPRGLGMIVAVLAVLKAGGAYLPLDIDSPLERITEITLDARARCVLVERGAELAGLGNCELIIVDINQGMSMGAPAIASQARPDSTAYVLYTSGSTGRPKGVIIENRQLSNYVQGIIKGAGLEHCRNFAMVQPLTVDSSVTVLYAALCTGATLHVIGHELAMDPVALSAYFEGEAIDCLKIAPSHLAALHSGVSPSRLVPRLRLIVGGEPSTRPWLTSVARVAVECTIFNHYGPTETTVGVLMHEFNASEHDQGRIVPIGKPLANCHAYILDQYGELVPTGVVGELHIGGESVARAYLNRPALTAGQFVPDPYAEEPGRRMYRTGDLARCLPGDRVQFCGRVDDQVKIRGYRVEPGEIRSVLQEHPDVAGAVVLPFDSCSGGRRLAAYVVSRRGKRLEAELRSFLARRLPDYMVPSDVIFLDRFPLSRHGKIDCRALPAPDWALEPEG